MIAYYGYAVRPLVIIAIPAAITVAWKPDYLIRDISWQLSFLAFLGVLVLAPLMVERWVRRPNTIKLLVIESTAAQVTTAPLILGLFANLSLISPLSNVVILPLVPLAMLLSFATGVTAMASPLIGAWVALPATGLLGLMVGLSQWFATWPYANVNFQVSTSGVLVLYALVVVLTFSLYRWRARHPEAVSAQEYSPMDVKLG
ncbi:MAG TPA: ComEC/Rec2 family competence protein [Candidatus Saccharimonadia bacterium]